MPLETAIGTCSLTGPRERNEDFCGVATPVGAELSGKGILAAVADGLGGHANGREASESMVRGLLADYYATPDTWGVTQSLDRVLTTLNRWLLGYAAKRAENQGMATTLSALVLRGRRYVTAHVGDSRVYLLRDGNLKQLTDDHVWDHPELRHVLRRALGLDQYLAVDYSEGDLCAGDCFLLVSDGVWGVLDEAALTQELLSQSHAETAASAIASRALSQGAQDNATAVVVQVQTLPEDNFQDSFSSASRLPLPPVLKPGQSIDGLEVEALLHASRVTLLYRVRDTHSGAQWVLKTLRPEMDDAESVAALVHEEWLAGRVTVGPFPQVIHYPRRTHLYYLMSWHTGATLKAQMINGHRFSVAEIADIGIHLLKGLGALHRLAIVHRDIKPDNLHQGSDGKLRILDLGVAASDGTALREINNPGTPSFMAPELFSGGVCSVSSDLYAAGVTLYNLLTGKYPYGEVEPFQHPKFGEPVPPTRYRPDVPAWLEAILLKACARDPAQRFETAEEFLLALERGETRPLNMPRRQPLLLRNVVTTLKVLLALSVVVNLVLAILLSR
ncbi:MAG: bifunctional protein-serine/threonine kinase/phosphatase [Gammaproteobacteria bacterium]|nr:bifunctional protein-serine/threonine kinase/phosphatase [Gammaproteobacteria bacterium]